MKSFLENDNIQAANVEFPDYYLAENPFPSRDELTEGNKEGQDLYSLYCNFVYKKETSELADLILEGSEKGKNKFWLLKNNQVGEEHNISVIGGLFRYFTISSSPRTFVSYVPFPVIAMDPLGGILKWYNDRMTVERFRCCVYGFVYDELAKLEEAGNSKEILPGINVLDLLERMNETNGEALDEILIVEMEEEPEIIEIAGRLEEGKEESESDSKKKEEEEEDKFKERQERRNGLAIYLTERIAAAGFSAQLKSALAIAITEGYEKGRSYIGVGEYRETVKALISLTSLFYKKAIVILDRLDDWNVLEETQQATILGALTELAWLFCKFGVLAIAANEDTAKIIGEDFTHSFDTLTVDMWPIEQHPKVPLTNEKATEFISYFVKFDKFRKEKKDELKEKQLPEYYPFTEDGISQLSEQVNNNTIEFLISAGEVLDKGKQQGCTAIDAEFVKQVL